jgi:multiple sugar transport system substrate-binding protein
MDTTSVGGRVSGRRCTRRRCIYGGTALAAAAAACGQPGPAAQTGGEAGRSRAPATLAVWEDARFKWREDVGKEITDPFLAVNPWLTLETSVPAGDAREKFAAAAAAGSPPDIYSSGSHWTQQDLVDGLTGSLEPYLKSSRVARKQDIWPSLRLDLEFRGHMSAMPYAPATRILFTHLENARKAGLDPEKPPTKWSEMEAAAQKAFRGGAGAVEHVGWYPFMGSGGNYLWLVPYWQLGGELLSADQTKVTLFNERAVKALTWLKKIVDGQGGWAAVDAFRKTFSAPAGEVVLMEGGTTFLYATLSERGERFSLKAPTMRYNVSTYPLPDEGGTVANYSGFFALPIARGSRHPDVAWLFIEHVTSAENNLKFALRWDRVPVRESSTGSQAYIGGDKGRALQAQEMKKRRFVISAPGGLEMLPHQDVVAPFMSGQLSLQDALREKERLLQEILDRYLERAKALKL